MSVNPTIYMTLDIGNTSIGAALFSNNKLLKVSTIRKNGPLGIKTLLSRNLPFPQACMVSSVVKKDPSLLAWLRKKTTVVRLHPDLDLPFVNAYHTPRTLGNDRLACAAGARALLPGRNVLIIDAGTCIKYDFVSADGRYLGGSIAPGLTMRLEALHHYTSALPLVKPKEISDLTGHDTTHSILSGVEYGIQFEMEGFITAYKKQYKNLKVVMTGGDALRLAKPLKSNIFAAPHLIHIGLYEILKKNLA